jgi:hypothetical protein
MYLGHLRDVRAKFVEILGDPRNLQDVLDLSSSKTLKEPQKSMKVPKNLKTRCVSVFDPDLSMKVKKPLKISCNSPFNVTVFIKMKNSLILPCLIGTFNSVYLHLNFALHRGRSRVVYLGA